MSEISPERQIAEFLGKYTPEIQAVFRACRTKLRSYFPRGYELVYDNYNALVFGLGASEHASDALVSVAGYLKWVTLFFLHGAGLNDPDHLLHGRGSQVRSIKLSGAEDLEKAAVQSLLSQVISPRESAFRAAPPLTTIIKSVSERQRPRRPKVSR